MAANTDLNLQKLLNDFLVHEEARVERFDGVSGKQVEEALAKASLMPTHIIAAAASHLAELVEYEAKEGTNPVYEHNKVQLEEAADKGRTILSWAQKRKDGRGWSAEYIEKSFTDFVLQKIEEMALEIQAEVLRSRSTGDGASKSRGEGASKSRGEVDSASKKHKTRA